MLELEFPDLDFSLEVRRLDPALERMAEVMAEAMRTHLLTATSADHHAIPPATDRYARAPLERSGELAGSIKAFFEAGFWTVGPTGDRLRVAKILAAKSRTKNRPARDPWKLSDDELARAREAFERTVEPELVARVV